MSVKGNGKYTLRCYSGEDRWGSGPFSNTSVVFGKHTQLSVTLCRVSGLKPSSDPKIRGCLSHLYKMVWYSWPFVSTDVPLYPQVDCITFIVKKEIQVQKAI